MQQAHVSAAAFAFLSDAQLGRIAPLHNHNVIAIIGENKCAVSVAWPNGC
jgi:hypothetical protein